jgi:5-methylcytosine-specific restriction endonuclease McrA
MKRFSRHVTRGPRWRALRHRALRRDGFACVRCGAAGRLEVDHVKPVRTHPELAFDLANLQSLCPRCHSAKTNHEITGKPPDQGRQAWRMAVRELEGAADGSALTPNRPNNTRT